MGGCRDRHTGFVRFGRRDCDPEVGRFNAQDPLGDTGGDHDLYEYCVDDPVNAVDPEGLKEKKADAQEGQPAGNAGGREMPGAAWSNSTEGESRHRVIYTERAGKPVTGEMAAIAQCMADSAGQDIVISGAWEPGHTKGSAHETGNAIDINKTRTPGLTREKAEEAYERCTPKDRSYAEEKWNLFHIQNRAGRGGATGFSPGVKPGK
ncbi:MAG: RHS repeat-associated core domain-containing protein [Thermodesulfobacteriota bacterium]